MSRVRASGLLGAGVAALAITVAACGGGGGSAPAVGSNTNARGPLVAGVATLTIPNATTAASVRRAQFVSPSAASLSITINGAAPIYADVSATSTLCTAGSGGRTCTIPVSLPVGTNAVSLGLYDGANGTGNLLGGGGGTQAVTLGTAFTIIAVLDANVASAGTPTITYGSGTSFVPGTAGTATVALPVYDADGNTIPPGSQFLSPLTITSSDPNVTVAPASWNGTSTLTLSYNGSSSVASSVTVTLTAGTKTVAALPVAIGSQAVATQSYCPSVLATGASEPVVGTYTDIYEEATFSGTLTPTTGSWVVTTYAAATPTPAPTATPAPTPTPAPTATPTPATFDYWTGTYSVPAFTTTNDITGSPVPVSATSGCVYGYAQVGAPATAGLIAFPSFPTVTSLNTINAGSITSFTFTPSIVPGSGPFTGTFTMSNGTTGTVTIDSYQTITTSVTRQALERLRSPR